MRVSRRWALGGLAAAAIVVGAAALRQPPRDAACEGFIRNIHAFEDAAKSRGFVGSWDEPASMRFNLAPPATESQVAHVEGQIGRPLPGSLRAFFLTCSAAVEIAWFLPGRRTETAIGTVEVRYSLVPPRPFSDEKGSPLLNSGGLRLKLDALPELWNGREMWRKGFLDAAGQESEAGGRAHYEVYARFWERGFPIMTNGGGDVVAIDMEDPQQRLLLAFHDGSDEPGWLFGQGLAEHLGHQSRLGFPGFEVYLLPLFNDEALSKAATKEFEARYTDRETVARNQLAQTSAVVIDADGPNGRAWRAWVGVKD